MDDNIFVKWNDKWPEPSESEANIIFDTDIGPDYDDTGVAVMLHNYANKGKVNILAMLCSTSAPYGAAYLNLLNIYYGRRDIPVGTLKSKLDILPTCRGYNFTINEYAKYETDILDGFHARDTPWGEFDYYTDIMRANEMAEGPGHNGAFSFGGKDYVTYHRRIVGDKNSHHRILCIDELKTENGRLQPVIMTEKRYYFVKGSKN